MWINVEIVNGSHCDLEDNQLEKIKSLGADVSIKGYNRHVTGYIQINITEIEKYAGEFDASFTYCGGWSMNLKPYSR